MIAPRGDLAEEILKHIPPRRARSLGPSQRDGRSYSQKTPPCDASWNHSRSESFVNNSLFGIRKSPAVGSKALTHFGHFFMSSRRASLRSENCPKWIGTGVRQLLESVSDFIGIRTCSHGEQPCLCRKQGCSGQKQYNLRAKQYNLPAKQGSSCTKQGCFSAKQGCFSAKQGCFSAGQGCFSAGQGCFPK